LQDERAKMAGTDIFISYKSERRKAAEHLAAVLTHYGYSVWFDYQLIKGSDFGLQIGSRIREARAVVVLWCARSVDSRWVVEEAALGDRLGTLIPVVIEPCELPLGFQRQDYIDMSAWDGAPRGHQLDPLIDAVEQRTGRPPHLDLKGVRQFEDAWRRYGAPSLRAFALSQPVEDVVGERQMPHNGLVSSPVAAPAVAAAPADHRHELMTFAAREWPDVRDSKDLQRLTSFEKYFAGTFYAGEARLLIERIEAGMRQEAERAEQKRQHDEEQRLRVEGRIPVRVGDREHGGTRWLLPGGSEPLCDVDGGPDMVVVPAGKFMMGSPDDEPERYPSEGPRHEVTFARMFAVGRHCVTRGQFAAFVNATDHKAAGSWRNSGFQQDDSHPAVCVSWDDAKAYAAWLATITGQPYRLPTEAEWEYAARAGTTTSFWWGSSIAPVQANYNGNYVYKGGGNKGEYRLGTAPVDSFAPNPWGLYNVHGNVWEWCEDIGHSSYEGAPTDGSAWIKEGQNGRVVRGGAWNDYPRNLRAAVRGRISAERPHRFPCGQNAYIRRVKPVIFGFWFLS
jgi:formylglycine-generating enzyme required for sulfatase activity